MAKGFIKESSDITAEACAWVAQLETAQLKPADLDAFREWMARSPRHSAEIKRIASLSMDTNVLAGMAEPLQAAAAHYRPIVKAQRSGARRYSAWATAASIIVALVLSVLFINPNNANDKSLLVVTTAIGEFREINLSDGSVVKLNTNSKIEVDYNSDRRKIRLLSGEVLFEVAHNPARPFLVYAGNQYVRAIGTSFVVKLLSQNFAITVIEGTVEVAETTLLATDRAQQQASTGNNSHTGLRPVNTKPVILNAGHRAFSIDAEPLSEVTAVSEREVLRELSWQDGFLDFADMPLKAVVREFSRYSDIHVEFSDPQLEAVKFGGIFRKQDMSALFDTLKTSYGIDVQYTANNKVLLARQHQHPASPIQGG